jgi:hypothetical protein
MKFILFYLWGSKIKRFEKPKNANFCQKKLLFMAKENDDLITIL